MIKVFIDPANEIKQSKTISFEGKEYRAERGRVIGTKTISYFVWEKANLRDSRHSTITFFDHECFGSVITRPLPPEIAIIPVGDERFKAIKEFRGQLELLTDKILHLAFPETTSHQKVIDSFFHL